MLYSLGASTAVRGTLGLALRLLVRATSTFFAGLARTAVHGVVPRVDKGALGRFAAGQTGGLSLEQKTVFAAGNRERPSPCGLMDTGGCLSARSAGAPLCREALQFGRGDFAEVDGTPLCGRDTVGAMGVRNMAYGLAKIILRWFYGRRLDGLLDSTRRI